MSTGKETVTIWLLILCSIAIFFTPSLSQTFFSKTLDVIQESESGWQLIEIKDYYFIMAPSHCASGGICTSIIKIDNNFDFVWEKTFKGIGPGVLTSMISTDSTLLFYGLLYAPVDTLGLSVLSINYDGDILNQWYYGTNHPDDPKGITLNNHGGFNIVLSENTGHNKNKLWILNCDSNGTILSKKQYGNDYRHTNVHSIIKTDEGGSILGCTGCLEPDCEYIEGFILILDSVGNIVNKIVRDTVTLGNSLYTFGIPTSSGGAIMTRSASINYYPYEVPVIYRFDSLGNEMWKYKFQPEEYSAIYRLMIAKNGDILGVGVNESQPYIDTSFEISRLFGGWIFRISAQGELKWNRIIGDFRFPGPGFGELLDISETEDGNFLVVGSVQDTLRGITPPYLTWDVWMLYIDSTGCLVPGCNTEFTGITKTSNITAKKEIFPFSITPNLADDYLYLKYNNSLNYNGVFNIQIINNNGQIQFERTYSYIEPQFKFEVSNLPIGLYYVRIISKSFNFTLPFIKT
ncbi:MAG TPA: hypothetical protein VFG10_19455 [Saprospiraceae bacterium]|nr:hypothetical protein [Saprospiraceae bacterium]